ncbi:uncharacterized protein [Chironomus tepperi]|uniref:uncharacterized protein n=1 Tax=Chironomus tepperi TaxID=113505 RepID=UPI00391FAB31
MGLCTYFINGNCRFGSKCVNDHIDLKTLLKNEAEAVINGKQWLLSCFGPFKESVVVPNFIPDQSFEEIRIAFMENSKNGTVQNYVNNLMTEYNNALRKMTELKTPSSDTLQLIASIYNTSNSSDQKTSNTPAQSSAPNPFQSSNLFGGNTQQQAMPSSSIFGTSSTQNNPFQQVPSQQPTSSIFATATTNNPQTSAFSFASASQEQPKPSVFGQSSVFGSTQNQNPGSVFSNNQSNIFGQQASTFAMPAAQSGTSAFGSTAVQQPTQSVFGSSAIQQPTQSIFGATNAQQPTQSVFGGTAAIQQPAQSVFGSTPAQQGIQSVFGAPAAPQPVQNIFGGTTTLQQPAPTQNIFATAATNPQNVFATAAANPQNVFGGSNPLQPASTAFGGTTTLQQPATNAFAGATTMQQPAQNVFAAATTNPQNAFGGFSQNQGQNQPFGQPQQTSVFGTTQQPQQPQQQSESMGGNIFSIQAPQTGQTSQAFGGNPFQQNVTFNDDHFYSKHEDLSPEQIQAFQADAFIPGKIPIMPPSRILASS